VTADFGREDFVRVVSALTPYLDHVVFVGGIEFITPRTVNGYHRDGSPDAVAEIQGGVSVRQAEDDALLGLSEHQRCGPPSAPSRS
jgi:hypothetical protein